MPLEISEIGVHIAVGGPGPSNVDAGHDSAHGTDQHAGQNNGFSPKQIDAIVSACVSEVLRQLRRREER